MKIGYGISVQESDDPYISIAEVVLSGGAEPGVPGAFLVDFLPFLKHVPSWFPGAGFQKKALVRWREAMSTMANKPFCHVKEQLVQIHSSLRELMSLFYQWFDRKVTKLCHPWRQASLSVFLTREILNGPGKKRLREMWLL